MSRARSIVISAWLIIGICLTGWSLYGTGRLFAEEYFRHGVLISYLITLSFALIAVSGALLSARHSTVGSVFLKLVAWLMLVYCLVYVLFGGLEDTGLIYASAVVLLSLIAVFTIFVLARQPGLLKS